MIRPTRDGSLDVLMILWKWNVELDRRSASVASGSQRAPFKQGVTLRSLGQWQASSLARVHQ